MRYRDAGVDIARADALKEALGEAVRSTWRPGVRPLRAGFAGIMEWPGGEALLAASMDGVGTKLHLALDAGRVEDAAADLVYHGANDLLVHGAKPLAFLDYIAQARLDPAATLDAIRGLSRACREVGAVLLGGETAEMPDTYQPGVLDVAGCMLGTVAPERVLDGGAVRPGDVLLGLASNGLHTNGFSLARRVLEASGLAPEAPLPGAGGERVLDALLAPHRWYGPALAGELGRGRVRGLAHVTGGGIAGNLARMLPEGCGARIDPTGWPLAAVFRWLIEAGRVPLDDARRTWNLGIGMIVVCAGDTAREVAGDLAAAGEVVFEIGTVAAGVRHVEWMGPS